MSSVLPGDLTPEAFTGDLAEIGWLGHFKHDDPEVVSLRSQLQQHAGIPNLEVVSPSEPGYGKRAAEILSRDGVSAPADPPSDSCAAAPHL